MWKRPVYNLRGVSSRIARFFCPVKIDPPALSFFSTGLQKSGGGNRWSRAINFHPVPLALLSEVNPGALSVRERDGGTGEGGMGVNSFKLKLLKREHQRDQSFSLYPAC